MRKLILAVLVIVVILLATPYIMGITTEKQVDKLVKYFSDTYETQVSVVDYQRGWLKSTYNLNVTLQPGSSRDDFPAGINFNVQAKVTHGPLIFRDGKVNFAKGLIVLEQNLMDLFNDINQQAVAEAQADDVEQFITGIGELTAKITILIGITNNVSIHSHIPAIAYQLDQVQITWDGFVGDGQITANYEKLQSNISIGAVSFTTPEANLQTEAITTSLDMRKHMSNIWTGHMDFNAPLATIVLDDIQKLLISDVHMFSESNVKNGLFSLLVKLNIKKLDVADVSYGPVAFASELRNIDAVALNEVNQQLQEIIDQTNLSREQQQALAMSLMSNLPKLLSKGAELDLQQLNIALAEGDIYLNAKIQAPLLDDAEAANLFVLLAGVNVEGKLQMPVEFTRSALTDAFERKYRMQQAGTSSNAEIVAQPDAAADSEGESSQVTLTATTDKSDAQILALAQQMTEKQLSSLIKNRILQHEGDNYVVNLIYKAGQLQLNGKAFTARDFQTMELPSS